MVTIWIQWLQSSGMKYLEKVKLYSSTCYGSSSSCDLLRLDVSENIWSVGRRFADLRLYLLDSSGWSKCCLKPRKKFTGIFGKQNRLTIQNGCLLCFSHLCNNDYSINRLSSFPSLPPYNFRLNIKKNVSRKMQKYWNTEHVNNYG